MLSTDFAVSMPSVEMIECEKVACINVMKEYLQKLKNMEHSLTPAAKYHCFPYQKSVPIVPDPVALFFLLDAVFS